MTFGQHEVGDFFLESDNIDAAKVYFEQDAFDKWYASLGHKVPPPDAFAAQKEQMQGSLEAQLRQAVAAGDVHGLQQTPSVSLLRSCLASGGHKTKKD